MFTRRATPTHRHVLTIRDAESRETLNRLFFATRDDARAHFANFYGLPAATVVAPNGELSSPSTAVVGQVDHLDDAFQPTTEQIRANLATIRAWRLDLTHDAGEDTYLTAVLFDLLRRSATEPHLASAGWVDTLAAIETSNGEAFRALGDDDKARESESAAASLEALASRLY